MKQLFVLLWLAAAAPLFAQSNCPLVVEKIAPKAPYVSMNEADADPWGSYLWLEYRNTWSKVIEGVRLKVSFGDILADQTQSVYSYAAERKVKPGKTKTAAWPDGVYTHNLGRVHAIVTIDKVVFADGSTWLPFDTSRTWQNPS